jgi:hypothetical protein
MNAKDISLITHLMLENPAYITIRFLKRKEIYHLKGKPLTHYFFMLVELYKISILYMKIE